MALLLGRGLRRHGRCALRHTTLMSLHCNCMPPKFYTFKLVMQSSQQIQAIISLSLIGGMLFRVGGLLLLLLLWLTQRRVDLFKPCPCGASFCCGCSGDVSFSVCAARLISRIPQYCSQSRLHGQRIFLYLLCLSYPMDLQCPSKAVTINQCAQLWAVVSYGWGWHLGAGCWAGCSIPQRYAAVLDLVSGF